MKELYKALHVARKEFSTVVKNGMNPHFKSKYANLESILDAVEKSLDTNGILIISRLTPNSVVTELIHAESGQLISSEYPLSINLTDQQKGSAITYGRRYNIQSLLNLVAEDDDGHGASKKPDAKKPEPKPDFDPVKTAENAQKYIAESEDPIKLESAFVRFKTYEKLYKDANAFDIYLQIMSEFGKKAEEFNV